MTLEYDINVTNKRDNETYNLSISNIPIGLIELKRELKSARIKGDKFNRIKRVTIKFYAKQSQMTIRYYLEHCIPIKHRQFFWKNCTE